MMNDYLLVVCLLQFQILGEQSVYCCAFGDRVHLPE